MLFFLNVGIVDEGVNSKTRILLEYWSFHGQSVDEAWYWLKWITWDSFEFEKTSHVCRYSISDPCTFYCRSYYAPFWCDLRSSSSHATNSYPYYAFYAQPGFVSPWDNTNVVLSLPDSSFPLAQYMGLEVGEPFGFDSRIDVSNACFESGDTFDEAHDLTKTPLEG